MSLFTSFVDELSKIAQAKEASYGEILQAVTKAGPKLKYPAAALAGVAGWETAKKSKRRYDIGKAYEEQMRGRG